MTAILDRCAGINTRAADLRRREALQSEAEKIDTRRDELRQHEERIRIALASAAVLALRGHLARQSFPAVGTDRAVLARVRAKVKVDPSRAAEGKDYKALRAGLDKTALALDTAVNAAWAEIVRTADPVNEKLLQRREQVPGQAKAVLRVRTLRGQLRELAARPPTSGGAFEQFEKAAQELASAWAAFDQGDIPTAVVRFFRDAQTPKGAPPELFTDEVRTWLAAHEMLAGVRVRFQGGT